MNTSIEYTWPPEPVVECRYVTENTVVGPSREACREFWAKERHAVDDFREYWEAVRSEATVGGKVISYQITFGVKRR